MAASDDHIRQTIDRYIESKTTMVILSSASVENAKRISDRIADMVFESELPNSSN